MFFSRNKFILFLFLIVLALGVWFIFSRQQANESVAPQALQDLQDQSETQEFSDAEISTSCSGVPTASSTEGPYYKPGSPERTDITQGGQAIDVLTLEGYVLNTDCEPIANAWLDFWQADTNGNYDLVGYNFRGHQYTDENGKYTLKTVIPAGYSSRTPHIHVKVRADRADNDSSILTTQLYFPGESRNRSDSIFRDSLVVDLKETDGGNVASFNFVVDTNQ